MSLSLYLRSEMLVPLRKRDDDGDATARSTDALWLTAVPGSSGTTMSDASFLAAIRHRYDLPPRDDLPEHCACGAALADAPSHFHACSLLRRTGVTKRHDNLVNHLASVCHAAASPSPCPSSPPCAMLMANARVPTCRS